METKKPATVEEYIAGFPLDTQIQIDRLREAIMTAAPDILEALSYGVIGYTLNGKVIWIAAYKTHIGVYPIYTREPFAAEMIAFQGKGTKASMHLPLNGDLPLDLIQKVVRYRVEQNLAKPAKKKTASGAK